MSQHSDQKFNEWSVLNVRMCEGGRGENQKT